MEVEFDLDKAKGNPLNHDGVSFEEAKPVLPDPYALTREDTDTEGEQRFVALGMGGRGRILVTSLKGPGSDLLLGTWKP